MLFIREFAYSGAAALDARGRARELHATRAEISSTVLYRSLHGFVRVRGLFDVVVVPRHAMDRSHQVLTRTKASTCCCMSSISCTGPGYILCYGLAEIAIITTW